MLSIGLMSGTSMDGIDAALIETDGKVSIKVLATESLIYDANFRTLLKAAEFSTRKFFGNLFEAKTYFFQSLQEFLYTELHLSTTEFNKHVQQLAGYFHKDKNASISFDQVIQHSTELHAEVVNHLLEKNGYTKNQIAVIGFHGQTLFHRPAKTTIQVGDGELLAKLTGITVVNDFRTRDVLSGGQGAPFAPLYHQALVVRDKISPIGIINCGGISNITVITGSNQDEVIGFDSGPGNGLVDRIVYQRTLGKEQMDKDGHYGKKGVVNEIIMQLLYEKSIYMDGENYFASPPPKSLDIGDLTLIPELDGLSLEDACATLGAFTADSITRSIDHLKTIPNTWILAGGGWNNPVITAQLKQRLEKKVGPNLQIKTADEMGWDSKTLEAQIFAYLAVRCLEGMPISFPSITQVPEPLTGGRVHLASCHSEQREGSP